MKPSNTIEYVESDKNKKLVLHDSNLFSINKTYKNKTYWKCTGRGCRTYVILDDGFFIRSSGFHLHQPPSDKVIRKKFYNQMKRRCKEEKTVSVKTIYRQELAKKLATSPDLASCLPDMRTAERVLYRTRGSMQPETEHNPKNTLLVLDQSLYKMELLVTLRGAKKLILDGHIFKHRGTHANSVYWTCTESQCCASAILSRTDNRLLSVSEAHNHAPPERQVYRKRFYHLLRIRIKEDPEESLSKIYKEVVGKFADIPDKELALPSEKVATGVMIKMRKEVLNPVKVTNKSFKNVSTSGNSSPLKNDPSKQGHASSDVNTKVTPEVCITINVKKELAEAEPYDLSLSPVLTDIQSSSPDSSNSVTLDVITDNRISEDSDCSSSLNLRNNPSQVIIGPRSLSKSSHRASEDSDCLSSLNFRNNPRQVIMEPQSLSKSCHRASEDNDCSSSLNLRNSSSQVTMGTNSLLSPCQRDSDSTSPPLEPIPRATFPTTNLNAPFLNLRETNHPHFPLFSNFYLNSAFLPRQILTPNQIPTNESSQQRLNYQYMPDRSIASQRPPSLSSFDHGTTPVPQQFGTYKRFSNDNLHTPNLNIQNEQKPKIAHFLNIDSAHSRMMKTNSLDSSNATLNNVTTNNSNFIEVPSKNMSMCYSSTDRVPSESRASGCSNVSAVPLQNQTMDSSKALVVTLDDETKRNSNDATDHSSVDLVPLEVIPGRERTTSKGWALSSSNLNRPEPKDALNGLFAFTNNFSWNHSDKLHQFTEPYLAYCRP